MELHLAQLNWLRDKHGVTGLTSRLNVPRMMLENSRWNGHFCLAVFPM
jgi:hypothetical protein